jgi:DNA-binding winged helix-turn-helix (wHTH) protein
MVFDPRDYAPPPELKLSPQQSALLAELLAADAVEVVTKSRLFDVLRRTRSVAGRPRRSGTEGITRTLRNQLGALRRNLAPLGMGVVTCGQQGWTLPAHTRKRLLEHHHERMERIAKNYLASKERLDG